MTADDTDPQDPESERRLPPLMSCDHCGRRRAEWFCFACRLKLCAAHRSCPSCDRDRDCGR